MHKLEEAHYVSGGIAHSPLRVRICDGHLRACEARPERPGQVMVSMRPGPAAQGPGQPAHGRQHRCEEWPGGAPCSEPVVRGAGVLEQGKENPEPTFASEAL